MRAWTGHGLDATAAAWIDPISPVPAGRWPRESPVCGFRKVTSGAFHGLAKQGARGGGGSTKPIGIKAGMVLQARSFNNN